MSAPSKIFLARRALAIMGAQSNIESFGGSNPESALAELHYDSARRRTLEEHDWGFARKTQALSLSSEPPENGWGFRYDTPSDMIAFRSILNPAGPNATAPPHSLRRASNGRLTILTNEEDASGIYTSDFTDTTQFAQLFSDAVMYLLANLLALSIPNAEQLAARMENAYFIMLNRGSASSANQDVAFPESEPDWISKR